MLVTLVSGSGSPGCTTTAVGLAAVWPRPVVLVEADPASCSAILAGYFRGQLDHPGLVDLVIAHRSGVLTETLPKLLLPIDGSQGSVLLGPRSPEQASGLAALWEPLLHSLRSVAAGGIDVLIDAGRIGAQGCPRLLVTESDATVLLCRSDLPAVAAARGWAAGLAAEESPLHTVGLVLVGEGRPYTGTEVARTVDLPVFASIEWNPAGARVFSHGEEAPPAAWWRRPTHTDGRWPATAYVRSLEAAAGALTSIIPGTDSREPARLDARSLVERLLGERTAQR